MPCSCFKHKEYKLADWEERMGNKGSAYIKLWSRYRAWTFLISWQGGGISLSEANPTSTAAGRAFPDPPSFSQARTKGCAQANKALSPETRIIEVPSARESVRGSGTHRGVRRKPAFSSSNPKPCVPNMSKSPKHTPCLICGTCKTAQWRRGPQGPASYIEMSNHQSLQRLRPALGED